jgi:4-diphosphocytidyl-2-C-methyl-D-erythritol kinase
MYFRREEFKRTARSPAKLNLFLEVFGRRNDGFHELETLMVPVRLYDSLTIVRTNPNAAGSPGQLRLQTHFTPATRLLFESQSSFDGSNNLVLRALELLRQRSGCTWGASVELVKRIPIGAGLGGGSSDAATALLLANHVWQLGWSRARLAELAAEIGSDVPFFLETGAAICRGRGERIERLQATRPLHFVLVKPPVELSTADVYRAFDSLPAGTGRASAGRFGSVAAAAITRGWLTNLGRAMYNALQDAATTLTPWLQRIASAFDELDCLAHQLSGSGSTYFGLCRHAQHARRVASFLKARGLGWVYASRSCP